MAEWLYDRNGRATIIYDNDCFRNKFGKVVGWISNNNVYAVNGRHRGWYEKGVFYDANNRAIGFIRTASGSLPSRPNLGGAPGTPGFLPKPRRPLFAGTPGRPGFGGWSDEDLKNYFPS
jgi:hypothetical protein